MVFMHNNHCAVKVSTKNIHSPLTPIATDIRGRQSHNYLPKNGRESQNAHFKLAFGKLGLLGMQAG